jgi:UDP-N-acetylmuramate--alanine ligase
MPPLRISTLDKTRPVHFAGIAGSAMSGLATIFADLGFDVVGTDPRADTVEETLRRFSIEVHRQQDGSRIPENTSLVVASAALGEAHPEISVARDRGIPVMTYAECVGALMAERRGIAVAGTHGKTTVTSMIVSALKQTGADPGFVIGGYIPALASGAEAGTDDIFVAEACEYNRSFLNLHPEIAVITGIEADHLDVYGNIENIRQAFFEFASNLKKERGVLVYAAACPNTQSVVSDIAARKISFGVEIPAEVSAANLSSSPSGTAFDLILDGTRCARPRLSAPGRHNVANALAAVAVCRCLGIDTSDALEALEAFRGASRRFELRGEAGGITIVDDYAHHPTELRLLLEAARERFPGRRIVLAFQPHQYSRTLQLMDDFAAAVAGADRVLIPNIYFARDTEADVNRFSPAVLRERFAAHNASVTYLGSLSKLVHHLVDSLEPKDVLLTAGAGDIDTIIDPVLKGLRARHDRGSSNQ